MPTKMYICCFLMIATFSSAAANAQTQPNVASINSIVETTAPFGSAKPINNSDLNAVTGRADLAQVVNAQNNGVVSGNTVTGNSQTGTIHFDSSSFQNLNGLSLLSANTGNNVSINSSLNVNVAINR